MQPLEVTDEDGTTKNYTFPLEYDQTDGRASLVLDGMMNAQLYSRLGELSDEEASSVDEQLIINLYSSELGKRILKSKKVVREAPFELKIPASDIFDEAGSEQILLQGVIDLYFYEDDEIVIVDYKTDSAQNIEQIKQKYRLQLEYYKLAAETICKKTVKNVILYLFSTQNMIEY